jgi:2-phosphosulfolactate phosphatase
MVGRAGMNPAWAQGSYDVRFEWGPVGAAAVAPGAAAVVVVDVLSFTTTLTLAVEHGIAVLPFPWHDAQRAVAAARRHDATLAVGRSRAGPGEISLSPATLLDPPPGVRRLVLPSPNGSAISAALSAGDGDAGASGSGASAGGATVVGAALRNASAAAAWVDREAAGRPIAVIAAGERWPDGSLRPAIEDLWGAGAVIDALPGQRSLSPEAAGALSAYASIAGSVSDALTSSGSGRELAGTGFEADVAVAMQESVSEAVPVLRQGWFIDGGNERRRHPG